MDHEIQRYDREQAPSPPLLYHPKPLNYHPKKYNFLRDFENWLETVNPEFKRKFEVEINLLKDEGGIPRAFMTDSDEESESEELELSTSARIARLRERWERQTGLEMEGSLGPETHRLDQVADQDDRDDWLGDEDAVLQVEEEMRQRRRARMEEIEEVRIMWIQKVYILTF
jgi:hypothetical protein